MALSVALPPAAAGGCSVGGAGRGSRLEDDVFGSLALLLGSQPSPSPSASSESSGIGSLGSLKSESLPSSPNSDDKKVLEQPVVQRKPQESTETVKVMYGGRNLLNLMTTLRDPQWQYRATFLPQSNPALFFENRSQYHRLGSVAQPQFVTENCPACGFVCVLAVVE